MYSLPFSLCHMLNSLTLQYSYHNGYKRWLSGAICDPSRWKMVTIKHKCHTIYTFHIHTDSYFTQYICRLHKQILFLKHRMVNEAKYIPRVYVFLMLPFILWKYHTVPSEELLEFICIWAQRLFLCFVA